MFPRRIPEILICILGALSLACLGSMYRAGAFSYHDVTLIADFLSNTARRGEWFGISQTGTSHFGIHFTPTLALLAPFFALFDTQFLVPFLSWVALVAGWALSLRLFRRVFSPITDGAGLAAQIAWSAFLPLNFYCVGILAGAHTEVLYVPLALGVLLLLSEDAPWRRIVPLWVLALGVRQDAGFFLAFQALLPLLAGRGRRKAPWVALGSLLFCVLAVKLVLPAFGGQGSAEHLARWYAGKGSSWGEVFGRLLTDPRALWDALHDSAFLKLNRGFAFLPLLSGWGVFVANVPGILFYASSAVEKRYLWYYGASFLLPGMIYASLMGVSWLARPRRAKWPRWIPAVALAGFAVFRLAHVSEVDGGTRFEFSDVNMETGAETAFADLIEDCPALASVAAEEELIVYAPNSLKRMSVSITENDGWRKADAVVGQEQACPGSEYRPLALSGGYRACVRQDSGCNKF